MCVFCQHNVERIADDVVENIQRVYPYGILPGRNIHIKGIADIPNISPELRAEIWFPFIEKADSYRDKMSRTVSTLFNAQFNEVLNNLKKNPPPEGKCFKKLTPEQERFISLWMFDQKKWLKEFYKDGKPHIEAAIVSGGIDELGLLGSSIAFNASEESVLAFIKEHTFLFATNVNDTTEKLLRNTFIQALEKGESVDKVAKRIKHIAGYSEKGRAKTIAQTEMIGAVNKGKNEADKQSGVVWGSQWIGSIDDRIRESHEELTMSEESVPLGESFSIGLEYPGDQGGPAEEVINCRCTTKPLTKNPRE